MDASRDRPGTRPNGPRELLFALAECSRPRVLDLIVRAANQAPMVLLKIIAPVALGTSPARSTDAELPVRIFEWRRV
jgi:hypothetical protein